MAPLRAASLDVMLIDLQNGEVCDDLLFAEAAYGQPRPLWRGAHLTARWQRCGLDSTDSCGISGEKGKCGGSFGSKLGFKTTDLARVF